MAKILQRRNSRQIELSSLNPHHSTRIFATHEVEWLAQIVWGVGQPIAVYDHAANE